MASEPDRAGGRREQAGDDQVRGLRAGRRIALAAVFEAEFGQRTADAILERHLAEEGDEDASALAREIVGEVVRHRDSLDARITAPPPNTRSFRSPGWTAHCCVAA